MGYIQCNFLVSRISISVLCFGLRVWWKLVNVLGTCPANVRGTISKSLLYIGLFICFIFQSTGLVFVCSLSQGCFFYSDLLFGWWTLHMYIVLDLPRIKLIFSNNKNLQMYPRPQLVALVVVGAIENQIASCMWGNVSSVCLRWWGASICVYIYNPISLSHALIFTLSNIVYAR